MIVRKNILFSAHARQRMELRKIPEAEILVTINYPDKTRIKDETHVAIKKIKHKRLLIVIYRTTGKYQKIITAMYTSKITKYL